MTWAIGDRVRIGNGKVVWIVKGFWSHDGGPEFVSLTKEGSGGYVNASEVPERLRAVAS